MLRVKDTIYKLKPYGWIFLLVFYLSTEFYEVTPNFDSWRRIGRFQADFTHYSMLVPDKLMKNEKFLNFSFHLKSMEHSAFIIMFEGANFEIVRNHLCNLQFFPGAKERLAAITLDEEAEIKLKQLAPVIPSVTLNFEQKDIPSNVDNRGFVVKQLVYLLRARISSSLAQQGISFWMMQQDTIWTENFALLHVDSYYMNYDLLFDTVGNDKFYPFQTFMKAWYCGATYFVKGTPHTAEFFIKVELMLRSKPHYPDSAIMTYLCGHQHFKCHALPKQIASCSGYFGSNNTNVPSLIQIDVVGRETKASILRKNNLYFLDADESCNISHAIHLRRTILNAFLDHREVQEIYPYWMQWYHSIMQFIRWDSYNHQTFLHVYESVFS